MFWTENVSFGLKKERFGLKTYDENRKVNLWTDIAQLGVKK